ncbi:MAG: arginine--tRNA ligase [Terrimonas sp.]|nr:arginine--tRNA ligase [Terrimonas sp.]
MIVVNRIREFSKQAISTLYGIELPLDAIGINATKPEFEGDYTLVLFSLVKQLKRPPEQTGQEIGAFLLQEHPDFFSSFNVIKGFLNLTVNDNIWLGFLEMQFNSSSFGYKAPNGRKLMVEYSSPNTNKPLHLGHLRNNFLGWSIAEISKASGYTTYKTCISNDRGIHICKSMVAWQRYAHGATPEQVGKKGDHFVGDYYVLFGQELKKEVDQLMANGLSKEDAEKEAPLMKAAQQMLLDWEQGKPEIIELWRKMNGWVYDGFAVTYARIGSDFDKTYYESNTYLLGKKAVEEGLAKKVFFRKEDGSVWIDLTAEGLDEKVVQRKDGTAVYITQDIGLAEQKQKEFGCEQSIYVVGDEQNYHFKVLKLICEKLGVPGAAGIYHLSYGMVELPSGRMKTREGTVVDADDLIDEMVDVAKSKTEELGKVKDFTEDELKGLYEMIGLGALKFFIMRVDPKKRMIFNPEESIDFHGFTGPFIQYTHARIKSILRKVSAENGMLQPEEGLHKQEKELVMKLEQYPLMIEQAAAEHNPSLLAIYAFEISKAFNTFYTEHSVINATTAYKKQLRLRICQLTAHVIKSSMHLLGIQVPERM